MSYTEQDLRARVRELEEALRVARLKAERRESVLVECRGELRDAQHYPPTSLYEAIEDHRLGLIGDGELYAVADGDIFPRPAVWGS